MARLEFDGVDEVQAKLKRLARKMPQKVMPVLKLKAEKIMTESKQKYVPVAPDGGALRSSGHVLDPRLYRQKIEVLLVYGGPSAPYALAIHEHPSDASPPSWQGKQLTFNVPGTGTKYLYKPLMRARRTLAAEIASELDIGDMV